MSDSEIELFSEDDPEVEKRPKKKQRRAANIFIEDQARVDDSEDDESDDEAEEGFEQAEIDDEPTRPTRYRKLDLKQKVEEEDAEQIAARLEQRYGRQEYQRFRGDIEHIPQQLLIPSVNDPKLWLVRCKPGSEKQIVLNIARKYFTLQETNPLSILSCFCRDNLKGYVYIEAEKQLHVQQAIDKMNNVYATKLQLVPVNEMVDCLRVRQKESLVKVGMWVRVKRGKYGGDLAQVLDVDDTGDTATVKLIPRLSFSKEKSDIRHPQKLFNPNEVNKRDVNQQQGGYLYQGEFFDKEGYLEKSIKIASLEVKNINPSLEEITKFSGGAVTDRGDDLSMLANVAKDSDFQTGEKIIVLSGHMKNVPGTVQSVENGVVTITPDKSYGLEQSVKFSAAELAKRFVEGDHAKVINGVHKDESGMVLKVENNVVTLLSDTTMVPIEVFSKDLRTTSEVTSITPNTSQYDIHDLIQLSPNEVGVITKIEKDVITILDPYGNQQKVKQQQIQFKRDSTRAVTSDVNGRPVAQKDDVFVLEEVGSTRKQATVLHIYRTFVYLKPKESKDSTGVFVTKNSSVALVSAKQSQQPTFAQPIGRPRGKDSLMAKTVTVTGGPFKGYLGIVKDTTESHSRVELHTNNRTITIEKSRLNVMGESGNARPDYHNNRYDYEARTPMHGSGAKTPAYGDVSGRTPAWNSGSKTPAWDNGSKTPAWDSGSKTPAWDSGARTPAWDAGSRTPARGRYPDTPAVPNTPYEDSSTPYVSATPGAFPSTPGSRYPNMNSVAPTPATPYDHATPMNPATPAPAEFHETVSASWVTDGILVEIKSGKHEGETGSCTAVEGGRATIQLRNGDSVILTEESLTPVVPQKRDGFKVLKGEYRGNVGHLLSIDGDEGVVKIEGNDEILMLQLDSLAKLA